MVNMFSYLIFSRLLTQSVKQFVSLVDSVTQLRETAGGGDLLLLMTG